MTDDLIDVVAERKVLGTILLDPSTIYEATAALPPDAFGDVCCAVVWGAMLAMTARGAPVELVTLAAELHQTGKLNAIGGNQYLGELSDDFYSTAWMTQHIELVLERYRQRKARARCAVLATRSRDVGVSSAEMEAHVTAAGLDLGALPRGRSECSFGDAVSALAEKWQSPVKEAPGIPTGLASLTRVTGGWHPGQLVVIAARPSVGKTALALQCVLAAGSKGYASLVCSLETRRLPLVERLVACWSMQDLHLVTKRKAATEEEAAEISQAAEVVAEMPGTILDAAHQSLTTIRGAAHRLKAQGKLDLVVIDYLQLITTVERKDGTREREVAEVTRGLKILAADLGVPVILLAQLNRDVEKGGRDPRLSDLRESGAVEQDADVVLFLHREGEADESPTESISLIVAKQRDGARGAKIPLIYRKAATGFYDAEPTPAASGPRSGRTKPAPSHYDPDEFGSARGGDN